MDGEEYAMEIRENVVVGGGRRFRGVAMSSVTGNVRNVNVNNIDDDVNAGIEEDEDEDEEENQGESTGRPEVAAGCARRVLAHLCSNMGLCSVLVAYVLCGGFMFEYLESGHEIQQRTHIQQSRDECLKELWTITGVRLEYDFIVVGAGSSGCVVAARLSENPDWNVLLLEAGGPEEDIQDVPLLAANLEGTDADWKYISEPSPNSFLGVKSRRDPIPRGKVMGGSSVLNYMAFSIGHKHDYDRWAQMGSDGWSFEDLIPYFKKMESYNVPGNFDPESNGDHGPTICEQAPYNTPISSILLEAFKQSGFEEGNYNSGNNTRKYSRIIATINNGTRWSTNSAYIKPNQNRKNLVIQMHTQVLKILIDPESKRTLGVQYDQNGTISNVYATKEVILSAGAINTPQILMLSGVGPKEVLSPLNISIIQEAMVGFNLMDHPSLIPIIVTSDSLRVVDPFSNRTFADQYRDERNGPFTIPGGQEVIAFDWPDDDGIPEVEYFVTTQPNTMRALMSKFDYFPQVEPHLSELAWMGICVLLKPFSTGRVTLRSNNPYDAPIIDLNFFDDNRDLRRIATLCQGYYRVFNASMQNEVGSDQSRLLLNIENCSRDSSAQSIEYLECLARYYTNTLYHQCGTCRMGAISDPRSVVDPQLRVIGIEKLRVVDSSIVPEIPSAHMNGPAIMIAEKAADLIKAHYAN